MAILSEPAAVRYWAGVGAVTIRRSGSSIEGGLATVGTSFGESVLRTGRVA